MGASLLTLGLATSCMERDRLITADKLPAAAQAFLAESFPGVDVSFAKAETEWFSTEYKVVMVDGMVVVFDGKGNWTDIDCKYGAEVPARLIPPQIAAYVAKHFPEARVLKLERDRRDYEVELDNGFEMKFDLDFRLIDLDDWSGQSADPLRTPCVAGAPRSACVKTRPGGFFVVFVAGAAQSSENVLYLS